MIMETVELRQWGETLGTRLLGEEIRHHVEELVDRGEVVHLDFGGIQVASPSFVDELVGKLFQRYGEGALRGRLRVIGASLETQALIRRMVGERMKEAAASVMPDQPAVSPQKVPEARTVEQPFATGPDPFRLLEVVQQDYLTYVRTFQQFQNPEIRDWVLERVQSGTLLWKPPFVQLSRPFAPGDPLAGLVSEGLLHPATPPVFRSDADDPASPPVQPY
jgi:hypothetical protein